MNTQDPENQNTENQNTENQNTENQNTENQNTENQNTENQNTENQNTENQNTENQRQLVNKWLFIGSIAFASIGLLIFLYYLLSLGARGWSVFSFRPIDINKSAQFGDFIGGVVGSIWALVGVLLFYLALRKQTREFELQRREFEMQRQEFVNQKNEFKLGRIIDVIYKQVESIQGSVLEYEKGAETTLIHALTKLVQLNSHIDDLDFEDKKSRKEMKKIVKELSTNFTDPRFGNILFSLQSSVQVVSFLIRDLGTKDHPDDSFISPEDIVNVARIFIMNIQYHAYVIFSFQKVFDLLIKNPNISKFGLEPIIINEYRLLIEKTEIEYREIDKTAITKVSSINNWENLQAYLKMTHQNPEENNEGL